MKKKLIYYFLIAAFLGQFSEGIFNIVCILLLTELGSSYISIGYMFVLIMLPSVFIQPISGPLIDSKNKAKFSAILAFIRGIFIALIPIWKLLFGSSILIIYISILISYIMYHLLSSTNDSMMAELTTEKNQKITKMIAAMQGALQVGLLSSALIAGGLTQKFNAYIPLTISAILYFISSILFFSIKKAFTKNTIIHINYRNITKKYFYELKEATTFLTEKKNVLLITALVIIPLPYFSSINTLLSPANIHFFNGNGFTMGLIDSFAGIGSLIATIAVVRIKNSKIMVWMISSLFLLGISTLIFPYSSYIIVACIVYMIMGIFIGFIKIYSRDLVYKFIPQNMVGRIFSLWTSLSLLCASFTSILNGYMASHYLRDAYIALGIVLVTVGFFYSYKLIKEQLNV
ncbi:MFS transporter [Limosilactobacillus reuteri]|uniref:MFS transporter n=1 Tax=Limosilactobacillus reuteri TaxID=1598 RepID=UPI001E544235|nr:MFS transporter [Limosilactobacillus reuteri]MCC4487566.1 MFS transporter [Limosilactobacillus reuteri]